MPSIDAVKTREGVQSRAFCILRRAANRTAVGRKPPCDLTVIHLRSQEEASRTAPRCVVAASQPGGYTYSLCVRRRNGSDSSHQGTAYVAERAVIQSNKGKLTPLSLDLPRFRPTDYHPSSFRPSSSTIGPVSPALARASPMGPTLSGLSGHPRTQGRATTVRCTATIPPDLLERFFECVG